MDEGSLTEQPREVVRRSSVAERLPRRSALAQQLHEHLVGGRLVKESTLGEMKK